MMACKSPSSASLPMLTVAMRHCCIHVATLTAQEVTNALCIRQLQEATQNMMSRQRFMSSICTGLVTQLMNLAKLQLSLILSRLLLMYGHHMLSLEM